ncbi:ABC transporter ATP-binding protein [Brachybacterium saurashtrense]|uniref:ABC transporter ATP-binding protein n=1 Tax=Brachybacterium saurashtrense TaxID=556288 RepID=A0A345YQD2_9MICO|nr:ABC transporter ATP-binding protein [Brachybacterium saurashtrense]AXK46134.1 ABC transporter ATP-binding protein [Brachybacterium saurashtrense]RRR23874.1 ABC transporter ATP-binding protein [Brachybacterium saurashtrense]
MTATVPPPPVGTRLDSLASLRHVLTGWRAWYALTLGWNVVVHLSAALGAGAAAYTVAAAVRGAAPGDLLLPALLVLVATLLRAVGLWQESYTSHDLSFRVMARVRHWILGALSRVAPAGLTGRRRGDLAGIALHDSEALEIFLAHTSLYRIGRFLATPLILVGLALIDLPSALVCVPFLLALLAIPALTRRAALREGERTRRVLTAMAADTQENVGAVREIVAFGLVAERKARLERLQDELLVSRTRTVTRTGVESAAAGIAAALLAVAVTAVGVVQVEAGRLELVWLPVAVAVAAASPSAIQQWISTSRHTGHTAAAARRIEQVLEAPDPLPLTPAPDGARPASAPGPEADSPTPRAPVTDGPAPDSTAPSGPAPADLVLEEVSFRWPGAPAPAVDRVSLRIDAGETVALAGRSGAGKSTLAQLLARWYDPEAGRLTLGGRDLRTLPLATLRRRVRLIPQDPHLFAETVRENLLLAATDEAHERSLDDASLWAALEAVGARDLVERLPQGLDTVLADHGRSLSGGERQRLALARAALHPGDVLVLDESVSQLDTGSAAAVQDAFAHAGRTTVVIAHRLVTLLRAPRILVLEHGRVVGDGTHDALLETCPAYRALVEPQLRHARAGAGAAEGSGG